MLQHIFLLVGLIFLLPSIYFLIQLQDFVQRAVPTTGTVVACDEAADSDACLPTVRFLTAKEESIDIAPFSLIETFSLRQKALIRYDPGNPHDAHFVSSDTYLYVIIIFFIILGVLFTAGGIFAEYMGAKGMFKTSAHYRERSSPGQRSKEVGKRERRLDKKLKD